MSQELLDSETDGAVDSRIQFQEHADEACVVIFVLSEAFAVSKTCQQQVKKNIICKCVKRSVHIPVNNDL